MTSDVPLRSAFQIPRQESSACSEGDLLARAIKCLIENVYEPLWNKAWNYRPPQASPSSDSSSDESEWIPEWSLYETIQLENQAIALAVPEWNIKSHHRRCQTQKYYSSLPKVDDIVEFLEGCSKPRGTDNIPHEPIRCIATGKWQTLRHALCRSRGCLFKTSTPVLDALNKVVENHREEFLPSNFTKD
jgi:hypothetical protein